MCASLRAEERSTTVEQQRPNCSKAEKMQPTGSGSPETTDESRRCGCRHSSGCRRRRGNQHAERLRDEARRRRQRLWARRGREEWRGEGRGEGRERETLRVKRKLLAGDEARRRRQRWQEGGERSRKRGTEECGSKKKKRG
ncbi:hypothetical protein PIB30_061165 [Stylosanthes scabra]|uniref:Uncharacterized protein n=1 Tax=Stylosanthes scabra TaxID=79078 RepID=A0ABU6ZJH0_9FABA|nr:hypothetical protein [Stylosanthes scabra]